MSGGSYDYICFKISEFAEDINAKNDPRRIAFKKLLKNVADAARAVEWEDSGDTSKEGTNEAIDAMFNTVTDNKETVIKAAAYDELKEILKNYIKA